MYRNLEDHEENVEEKDSHQKRQCAPKMSRGWFLIKLVVPVIKCFAVFQPDFCNKLPLQKTQKKLFNDFGSVSIKYTNVNTRETFTQSWAGNGLQCSVF